ncbi:MAG: preprotein translocase subunit SecA [Anaerolineae bacterium]|jgi:preprotein translocase subunit SecA|nr:preprotein translocase subunit SecA [Anaerolineae bacterium]
MANPIRTFLNKIFGNPSDRILTAYRQRVEKINALEPALQALNDAQLRAKTQDLRAKVAASFEKRRADAPKNATPDPKREHRYLEEALNEVLEEAFAVVREAARRVIGQRPYDVQLIGGMVLHEGRVAEMKTGEGKTLTATLPIYLNALAGRGVHLVTPNDYLSKVGLQAMGPIYDFLGMSCAVIQNIGNDPAMSSFVFDTRFASADARYQNLRPCSRVEAYAADITYGTNNEYGFDYLRDNMAMDERQLVQQRGLFFAIVDEVDNILIDEARTPLIISGQADKPSDLYGRFAQLVKKLKPSSDASVADEAPDGDYVIDHKDRLVYLTDAGVDRVEGMLGIDDLYNAQEADKVPYLDNCLRAHALYHKDKEYVVQDGQIIIVDEFTGRLMYGRRFSEGLHQAIEAKEGVEIRRENLTLATITFQNFFLMYAKLAGMTGTAMTEAEELMKIYSLDVVAIPTNLPTQRQDNEDQIFVNEKAKFEAIVGEIKARNEKGQPILIGTTTIETSERLAQRLKTAGIRAEVLNAKQHEREAVIIAQAGRPGAVTIATNMAGRGVDILLGGNPDGLARQKLQASSKDLTQISPEEWQAALAEARAQTEADRAKVLEEGGLFVLGTERHEARRIDNQLRGRSGRQGDPGETRFFLSIDDDLVRRFGGERMRGVMNWAKLPEDEPIEHPLISRMIQQAQVRVEGYYFDTRKRVKDYDDVVNRQRDLIYTRRRQILKGSEPLREDYFKMIGEAVDALLEDYFEPNSAIDEEQLYHQVLTVFPAPKEETLDALIEAGEDRDAVRAALLAAAEAAYDKRAAEMGANMVRFERQVMLTAIDTQWQRHLTDLDMLREGIGLVSIAQRDPLVEYKRESFSMFDEMEARIREQALKILFYAQVRQELPLRRTSNVQLGRAAAPALAAPAGATVAAPSARAGQQATAAGRAPEKPQPVRAIKRPGPNEPCWCGSGKKYKVCHMREDQKLKG